MSGPSAQELEQMIRDGSIKLEITGGIPTWEAHPNSMHQIAVDEIRATIQKTDDSADGCPCYHIADLNIQFRDGSIKRPDISIFCEKVPRQLKAITLIPGAVIEVISVGYEYKDLVLNPQFYLAQGVLDVIIVDPLAGVVSHYKTTEVTNHRVPVTITLQMGCQCTIPADE